MFNFISKTIGGIVSDTIELSKTLGESITDIPKAFKEGYNNGLLIDTNTTTKTITTVPKIPNDTKE